MHGNDSSQASGDAFQNSASPLESTSTLGPSNSMPSVEGIKSQMDSPTSSSKLSTLTPVQDDSTLPDFTKTGEINADGKIQFS